MVDRLGPGLPADPDSYTRELFAEARDDRLEPVIAAGATAAAHPQFPEGQVEIIGDHEEPLRRDLVPGGDQPQGRAAVVHIRLGLYEQDPALAQQALFRPVSSAPGCEPETARQLVDDDEADIVTGECVFSPRIPEAGDDTEFRFGYDCGVEASAAGACSVGAVSTASRSVRDGSIEITIVPPGVTLDNAGRSLTSAEVKWSWMPRPRMSTARCSGTRSAGPRTSRACVTTSRTPPKSLTPGETPTGTTGRVAWIFSVRETRWKSAWRMLRVIGSRWTSRSRTVSLWPST